ncbi:MAG TPA: hypothetical protein V6C71_24140 [Coleofasciculaceae cyanobacterium]|jgi:hypothetical protein
MSFENLKLPQEKITRAEIEANIVSYGKYPLVSNFARTRFEFQRKRFASTEAFIQYIKYPENHPTVVNAMIYLFCDLARAKDTK